MVTLAVLPPETGLLPTGLPSMVKLTVPVGTVVPLVDAVMVAVTTMLLPAVGVALAGATVMEVVPLVTVMFTPDVAAEL
jgi:hypothetical protein